MVENRAIEDILISVSKTHSFNKEALVFLNTSDVLNGDILVDSYMSVSEMKGQAKKTIENGDILYSEIRPKNRRFAYVKVDKPEDFVVSTKLMVLRNISNDVLTDYIYYFITYQGFIDYLQMRAENRIGSFPQITFDVLKSIKVPVPSMKVQQEIVDAIKSIDQKIELNNQINAELEGMAKLVYDYWFVQFDFPILASYSATVGKPELEGKPYKASGGKMVYNEELKREIPEGWRDEKLSQLAFIKAGGDKPRNYTNEETEDNYIPIFSNGIKNEGLYGFTDKAIIIEPSLTVSARGTIGFCVLRRKPFVPIIRLIVLTPNSQNHLKFLHEYLKELDFENSGSVQQQLTVPQISNVNVLNPPNSILDDFSKLTTSFIRKIDLLKEENQELSSLRDWLLPMLMNGQVSVRESKLKSNLKSKKVVEGYGEVGAELRPDEYREVAEEGANYNISKV